MKFKTYESVKPQHTNGVCVDFEHECNVEVRFFLFALDSINGRRLMKSPYSCERAR